MSVLCNCSGGQISFLAPDFSSAQFYLRARSGGKMRDHNQSIRPIETTKNIAFCYLLSKQDLQLSFEMCFHQKFLQ